MQTGCHERSNQEAPAVATEVLDRTTEDLKRGLKEFQTDAGESDAGLQAKEEEIMTLREEVQELNNLVSALTKRLAKMVALK